MLGFLAAGCLAAYALCAASLLAGRRPVAGRRQAATGPAAVTSARLAPLFIFLSPRQVRLAGAATGLFTAAAVHALGLPALAAAAAGLLAPCTGPALVGLLARRRSRRVAAQLPDALTALAAGLRAGRALPQALALVAGAAPAPLGQELMLAVREAGVGKPLEASLDGLLTRCPVEDVRLAVAGIVLGRQLGGDLADLLDRVTESIRERQRLEARMRVLTAQGRAQGLILALLPPALAAVVHAIDPDYLLPLIATGSGRAILAVTAALELVGLVLIRRIVAVER
jgi:tight adherence protein B